MILRGVKTSNVRALYTRPITPHLQAITGIDVPAVIELFFGRTHDGTSGISRPMPYECAHVRLSGYDLHPEI